MRGGELLQPRGLAFDLRARLRTTAPTRWGDVDRDELRRDVPAEARVPHAARPGQRDPGDDRRRLVEVSGVQPEEPAILREHRGLAVARRDDHDESAPARSWGPDDVAGLQRRDLRAQPLAEILVPGAAVL